MSQMWGRRAVAAMIVTTLAAGWLAAATPSSASARPRSTAAAQASTAPPGYGPVQLQSAYELPSASAGNLQTVAVIAPFDDPNAAADLATYRTQFGELPCPQTQSLATPACFTEINEAGALITPGSPTAPTANSTWALETSAQLDAVSAVCPNCRILLVEVNSAAVTDLGTGVEQAVSNGAHMVTIGTDQPEVNSDPTWDTTYFDQPGVAITVAAGNNGYQSGAQNYPAASEYVTAVGGTALTPAGTGACTAAAAGPRDWCETVWNDSDGDTASGCSLYDPAPPWQKSDLPAADTGCGSLRSVADVAADADPATGIAVYDSYGEGGWQGGTGPGRHAAGGRRPRHVPVRASGRPSRHHRRYQCRRQ
jgi:subtilase family serine protease